MADSTRLIEVSFIVLNWRKLDITLQAVKSIRAQKEQPIEVIIIDNESDGKQLKKLQKVADKVVVNKTNRGFATGCNQGAQLARGHILAFVNNDAQLPPHWLKTGLNILGKESDTVAVAGGERLDSEHTYSLARINPRTAMVTQGLEKITEVTQIPYAYGSNLLIQRSAFEAVGGFEEAYFAYYEDVDLGAKLAARGFTSAYAPGMEIDHEVGTSTGAGQSSFRNNLIQRNKYRYIANHFSHWLFFVAYTACYDITKFFVGNAVIFMKRQTGLVRAQKRSVYLAQLQASGWALSHLTELLQSRRATRRAGNYASGLRRQLAAFYAQR